MANLVSFGVLVLVLSLLAVAAPLAVLGQGSNSSQGAACLDKDGDGLVGIAELFDVIDAYFDQTPWSEMCPAPEPDTTPTPEPTPTATPTPTPTPTPDPVDLATTDTANLWISLSQEPDLADYLRVWADTAFDVEALELSIYVDGTLYCNTSTMYADEGWYEMGCGFDEKLHTDVDGVSVQTSDYPDVLEDLRCGRNYRSIADETIFACVWRSTPVVDPLAMYDDNDDGRITCAEAQAHGIAPVHRGHPAYPYMDDADNDGVVCES